MIQSYGDVVDGDEMLQIFFTYVLFLWPLIMEGLSLVTPSVTRKLGFCDLIQCITSTQSLFTTKKAYLGSVLTEIPTGQNMILTIYITSMCKTGHWHKRLINRTDRGYLKW